MVCPGGRGDDKGDGGACVIGRFSMESIPVATQLLLALRGLKILLVAGSSPAESTLEDPKNSL